MLVNKNGFTLVELVVVVTIIGILATIGIISYMGYGEKSRDSVRVRDLSSLNNLLELYKIEYGSLPIPTDGISVNYSGAVVWVQGNFGENIAQKVKNKGSRFLDPETEKPYSYSVLNNLNEYQLGTIIESNDVANMSTNQTKANNREVRAYLQGNYNSKAARTQTGGITYVLATPSITTSRFGDSGDFIEIIDNNWITYHKTQNIPYAYRDSKYKLLGGQSSVYHISKDNINVYQTTNIRDIVSNNSQAESNRIGLLSNIQQAYNDTVVSKNIQRYMSANTQTPDNYTKTVANELAFEIFDGKINSQEQLFALIPFNGDGLEDDGTPPTSGGGNNTPTPVYNSNYNITFNKSDGVTYTCTTCN